MNRAFIAACFFLFILFPAYAGNSWYVDPNAAGSNNGTSWANAWKSPTAISWGSVQPGDTIYLSGGASSQTYTSTLTVGTSGTSGNPVTIADGCLSPSPAGHNGTVIFNMGGADNTAAIMNSQTYVTINGYCSGVSGIIPGINMLLENGNQADDSSLINGSLGSASTQGSGVHIEYVEVKTSGNGIVQSYGKGGEIDHVYVHDIACDGAIEVNGSLSAYSGDMSQYNLYGLGWLIHDSVIQVNNHGANDGYGPDGIQGTHGLNVYNNQIYGAAGTVCSSPNHQDAIQIGGAFYKIYGNYTYCTANSVMEGEEGDPTSGFDQVYDNVFAQCSTQINSHGIEISSYTPATRFTSVLIANNTFVDFSGFVAIRFLTTGTPVTTVDNIVIQNNIIYDSGPYDIESPFGSYCGTGVIIDSNNINPGSSGSSQGTCNGNAYTDTNRKTAAPSFVSYSQYAVSTNNLHLAAASTVDNGVGVTLASFFTTDKDGATRTVPWALGAYIFGGTSAGQPTPPTNVVATVQQ